MNFSEKLIRLRKREALVRRSWRRIWRFPGRRCPAGSREFPIVKDTTPNMMNPRLYTTSYNKP